MNEVCTRCGAELGSWEDYSSGAMTLNASSQIFAALRDSSSTANDLDFLWWNEAEKPFIHEMSAQHAVLRWGDKTPDHLCYDCNRQLISVIGRFFGFPQWKPAPPTPEEILKIAVERLREEAREWRYSGHPERAREIHQLIRQLRK